MFFSMGFFCHIDGVTYWLIADRGPKKGSASLQCWTHLLSTCSLCGFCAGRLRVICRQASSWESFFVLKTQNQTVCLMHVSRVFSFYSPSCRLAEVLLVSYGLQILIWQRSQCFVCHDHYRPQEGPQLAGRSSIQQCWDRLMSFSH